MVLDAPAAGLAPAQWEAVHTDGAPAVLRGAGFDLLPAQPGSGTRVLTGQFFPVYAHRAPGHEQRVGRLEPLFEHAARQHTAAQQPPTNSSTFRS